MAKGKKTGGRDFPKGVSGNPSGGRKLTELEKSISKLTPELFAELIQKVMTMSAEELRIWVQGPGIPLEEELFVKHVLDLSENPNWASYDKYLTRRIGKPKETVEIEGDAPMVTHAHVFQVVQEISRQKDNAEYKEES